MKSAKFGLDFGSTYFESHSFQNKETSEMDKNFGNADYQRLSPIILSKFGIIRFAHLREHIGELVEFP